MDISSVIQQDFISIGKKEQRKVYKGRNDNNRWEKQTRQRANRDVIDNDNEIGKRETDQERSDVPWSLREMILLLRVVMP